VQLPKDRDSRYPVFAFDVRDGRYGALDQFPDITRPRFAEADPREEDLLKFVRNIRPQC
jgi:hypothetical protein